MSDRVVHKARIAGRTGAIVAQLDPRIVAVGIDPEGFPSVWFETAGPVDGPVPDDTAPVDIHITIVWTGEWHDTAIGDHVGTYHHDHLIWHVYARTVPA